MYRIFQKKIIDMKHPANIYDRYKSISGIVWTTDENAADMNNDQIELFDDLERIDYHTVTIKINHKYIFLVSR